LQGRFPSRQLDGDNVRHIHDKAGGYSSTLPAYVDPCEGHPTHIQHNIRDAACQSCRHCVTCELIDQAKWRELYHRVMIAREPSRASYHHHVRARAKRILHELVATIHEHCQTTDLYGREEDQPWTQTHC